jgi:hypothetical protein
MVRLPALLLAHPLLESDPAAAMTASFIAVDKEVRFGELVVGSVDGIRILKLYPQPVKRFSLAMTRSLT